jgi:hypothetical protein
MRRSWLCLVLLIAVQVQGQSIRGAHTKGQFGQIPLYFEENHGQTNADVAFVARSSKMLVFVTRKGATLSSPSGVVSMNVAGANLHSRTEAEGETEGVTNYYLGSRALVGLKHYSSIRIRDVRPSIDLLYHGSGVDLEYDFVLHPGADPGGLRLLFNGAKGLRLDDHGDIILTTDTGEIRQKKPRVWQGAGKDRREVDCKYAFATKNEVRLVLGEYQRSAELVIDPIIGYSTLLGASRASLPTAIAVDGAGDAFVTGWTNAVDFPVTRGQLHGSQDAFVTELNPDGTALIYSTYIGGKATEQTYGIALDSAGDAYVTGLTTSKDFPFTSGAYVAGQDVFVVKVDSTGAMVYATALGGSGDEAAGGIAVDSTGSAYVAGSTSSDNFPVTQNGYSTTLRGQQSAFVVKLGTSGQIFYGTYLGGKNFDGADTIAVDSSGDAYVGGYTNSPDFPSTAGAYSTAPQGQTDGFVAELNPQGSALVFATFLGGTAGDSVRSVVLDATGCYVTGSTFSTDFPVTPGAFLTVPPSRLVYSTGFVSKLNLSGTSLVYSTYLGGSAEDDPEGLAVDSGYAYIVGMDYSGDFPTTVGALKSRPPESPVAFSDIDMFLTKLSPDGSSLSYSTLFGATGYGSNESALGVALDGRGGVYMVGAASMTAGAKFPFPTTPGAFQTTQAGQAGGVVKIDLSSPVLCTPGISPASQDFPGYGGAFSFTLTLAPGCPWEAIAEKFMTFPVTADPFITLNNPVSGLGSSSPIQISGTVAQNNSTRVPLAGSVRIGTAIFSVNQSEGSCGDPLISPTSASFDSIGGVGTFTLSLPTPCPWTAVSNAPWLSVTANPSGMGSSTISVAVGQNSFSQRTATLTLAGTAITVTQSGSTCTATASGAPLSFSGSGGTGLASITTSSQSCTWTAYSEVPWIQLPAASASGQGTGGAPFLIAGNPGLSPRTGSILIGDQTLTITQAAGPGGNVSAFTLSKFAGTGALEPSSPANGDGGPAQQAYFHNLLGLAWDASTGTLLVVDSQNSAQLVRAITPDGNINTVAGGGALSGDNLPATSVSLGSLFFVGVDNSSSVYISEYPSRVRKIAQGNIATFAGGDVTGFGGDGAAATNALLDYPRGVAADSEGNIYIADNDRIREVSGGIISTVVGGGTGKLGDGGPATEATLGSPYGIAFDSVGSLYIADSGSNRVRKVSKGAISTIAGGGKFGDGVLATKASLFEPAGVAVDLLGNVFILEPGYGRIRMVSTVDGTISTVSSYGAAPNGLATDTDGNLYYTDNGGGSTIKKLTPVPSFCSYVVAAPPGLPITGGSFSVAVTAAGGCNWTSASSTAWITISSGTAGAGKGTVTASVAANPGPFGRSGVVVIAGQVFQVNQAGLPAPVLTVASQHVANFYQGEQGAQYTITVSDLAGTQPTNGVVVLTEAVPAGLTLVSMAGDGWTCPGTVATNCTRSEALNGGASYTPVTVTANVATNASSPKSNMVTVSGGGSVSATTGDSTVIIVPNPAPSVTQLSPANASAGAAALTLKLTGKHFFKNSVVLWGGSARATTYVSNTMLKAAITAQDLLTANTIAVSVMTPAPGGGISGALSFTTKNPVPVVSSLSPASLLKGSGDFILIVNGQGFMNGSVVEWNGSSRATTFVSSTQLSIAISAGDVAAAGIVPVQVNNPTPGGGPSGVQNFAINNPAPVVISLSPSSSNADVPTFTLTVTGSNFVTGSTLVWNGAALSTMVINSSQLSASIPASSVTTVGTDGVAVVNPAPGGGPSISLSFTVNNPTPIATSLSPSSATAGGASITLTVKGSHFLKTAKVLWNGAALATTFVTSTQLKAKVPASDIVSSGMADVSILNPAPGGGSSGAISFTVH